MRCASRYRSCCGRIWWDAMLPFWVTILLVGNGIVIVAATLQHRGLGWPDQICSLAYGYCDQPLWLGAAAAILVAILFATRTR